VHLSGTVVLLTSHEPSNYGSWLFRALPKVLALQYCGSPPQQILAYAHSPAMRQSLVCCGIETERLLAHDVNAIYEIDRLILPCLRNSHAYLDPETRTLFAWLRNRFQMPGRKRRLYVSRFKHRDGTVGGRVMQNEMELIAELQKLDFEIVQPETLSFEQQVATFASASLVVGPSGSGLFNVAFCHPGTRLIDIESEPHWIHAHLCLFSSCELEFGIFLGKVDDTDPSPVHRRWSVNIPALRDRINAFDQ
jgi:capsular polysaccharide biosynthesis protein